MSYWKAYESCMSAAKRSRDNAVHFARRNDFTRAFAHAETAKTAQCKADEHFENYIDALALNDARENPGAHETHAEILAGDLARDAEPAHDVGAKYGDGSRVNDVEPAHDVGVTVGDLARDAKSPRDIYS